MDLQIEHNKNAKRTKADMMLILATLFWGVSYYMTDICLDELDPFTLNTYRFLGAFFIAAILSFPKMIKINFITIRYSFYIGVALYFTYIGATFGVKYTSLSNAGFLCALSVVFTPIFNFIFRKIIPGKKLIIVVFICLLGIALLTLDENMKFASGDILCILCAVAYAVDMIITEVGVNKEKVNAFQVSVYQMFFTGILCMATAFLIEKPALPQSKTVWISLIVLTVFCTGLAFMIQVLAQQYTTAAHVGVIFTLEPVFAGIVAFFFAGEILLPRAYLGAIFLLLSIVVMEFDLKKFINVKMDK